MGDLPRFEDTLVSVLENRPERSEIIVVTSGPYDDPYNLGTEVVFVEAPAEASLLECLAAGLAASHAAVVHVLAAGVEATPGWAEPALARFDDPEVAAVAPLVVDRNRPQRVLSAGLRYTTGGAVRRIDAGRLVNHIAAGDGLLCGPEVLSAFYRREALTTIASLPNHTCPQAVAIELALALRRNGYRCVQEPQCLTTAARQLYDDRGGCARVLPKNGSFAAGLPHRTKIALGSRITRCGAAKGFKFRCGRGCWAAWPAAFGRRWDLERYMRSLSDRGRSRGCPARRPLSRGLSRPIRAA